MKPLSFFLLSAVSILYGTVFAQRTGSHSIHFTLPEVALIDVEPEGTSVTLTLGASTEAGLPVNSVTNNTKWINYSSAVPLNAQRHVTAQLSGSALPQGVELKLLAANAVGAGAGARGSSAGLITLSAVPQPIINGIGGAYTGNGINNGHRLTYILLITDFGQLSIGTTNVSVLFTLTDSQ